MATVFDAIKEREFGLQLESLFKLYGYLYYHTFRAQYSKAGFPDYVLIRPPEPPIYAEIKSMKGKLSPAQREFLLALVKSGQRVYVWNPSHLTQIIEVLR